MSVVVDKTGMAGSIREKAFAAGAVAIVVFAASLFGILTRPVGFLAALWPANAILLGLMVRNPRFASLPGWAGAAAGYLAADLLTGGDLGLTIWLTVANLAGAMTGVLLYWKLREEDRRLQRPQSVLFLFAVSVAAASVAAVAGGGAARIVFGRDFVAGLEFWFVTELVNSLVVLPSILTFPGWQAVRRELSWTWESWTTFAHKVAPVIALALSAVAGVLVGGPGALAFPVPALLWCALSYSVFSTAVLTMGMCGWLLVAISTGTVQLPVPDDVVSASTSIRLGVALLALGPLTVASVNVARTEVLARLTYAASHDSLTGVLARQAFMLLGSQLVAARQTLSGPVAVLMLDVDHFKQVNDRFGHAFGDKVLVEFSATVNSSLRPADLLGRTGGEEFAVVLPDTGQANAERIAERIRRAVEGTIVMSPNGQPHAVTVSIGVAVAGPGVRTTLDRLLSQADARLYSAKMQGRNRIAA